MLAATTILKAGDWIVALLVVILAVLLDRFLVGPPANPPAPLRVWWSWMALLTLFCVVLFGVALTVRW